MWPSAEFFASSASQIARYAGSAWFRKPPEGGNKGGVKRSHSSTSYLLAGCSARSGMLSTLQSTVTSHSWIPIFNGCVHDVELKSEGQEYWTRPQIKNRGRPAGSAPSPESSIEVTAQEYPAHRNGSWNLLSLF
eukprot:1909271-Amphidinium_carterae.3